MGMVDMFFGNDEFMEYAGFRNMLIEDKLEECLEAVRRGETSFDIDADDLTEDEIEYLKKELKRKIEND